MRPPSDKVLNTAKLRSLCTFACEPTSVIIAISSNSRNGSPILRKTTRGGGSLSTSAWALGAADDQLGGMDRVLVAQDADRDRDPPGAVAAHRFFTTPEIRFEFGTITAERSKVWISVERTLMRRT